MRHVLLAVLLTAAAATSFAQMPYDLVGSAGVVHIQGVDVDGHHETHLRITSNRGIADLTFDGRTIRFGDGYSIAIVILANTPNAFVARYAAAGPDGASATAIVGKNLRTGEVTSAGVDDVTRFLRRSGNAQLAGIVMRSLDDQPTAGVHAVSAGIGTTHPRKPFMPAPEDCATSGVMLTVSIAGVFTCPEGTITCIGGVLGTITQTYSLATGGCGYTINDTTGWG